MKKNRKSPPRGKGKSMSAEAKEIAYWVIEVKKMRDWLESQANPHPELIGAVEALETKLVGPAALRYVIDDDKRAELDRAIKRTRKRTINESRVIKAWWTLVLYGNLPTMSHVMRELERIAPNWTPEEKSVRELVKKVGLKLAKSRG